MSAKQLISPQQKHGMVIPPEKGMIMKRFKKILAMVIAMAMVLGMSAMTAFADATININDGTTINGGTDHVADHSYKVYQIFTGTVDGDKLTDIKYGANFPTTMLEADKNRGDLVSKSVADAISDAQAYARQLVAAGLEGEPFKTAVSGTSVSVPEGYYLIVDDTTQTLDDGDAYSAYIVEIRKDTTIQPKKEVTEVDKVISGDTPNHVGDDDKNDNVSIGDTVDFTITAKIPTHAVDYDYYYFIVGDTLDPGLTFSSSSVVVKAGTTTLTKDAANGYKLYDGQLSGEEAVAALEGTPTENEQNAARAAAQAAYADGKTFQVALLNAKAYAGQTITITYSATLNENATLGETSNDNTVTVTYSNNPNETYNGTNDDNQPGKPNSETKEKTGETPVSETETYTTGIKIQKTDGNSNLAGATFQITGTGDRIGMTSYEEFVLAEAPATGEYYLLTDGTYTKDAPSAQSMKALQKGESGSSAGNDGYVVGATGDETDITVGGTTYHVYNADNDGNAQVYILVESDADSYVKYAESGVVDQENGTPAAKYVKETKYAYTTEQTKYDVTKAVDSDGILDLKGLGAGTYTIHETVAPDGYNLLTEDYVITISFDEAPEDTDPHWSATAKLGDGDAEDLTLDATGYFPIEIVNNSGTELPSTGGIGTTIFYVVGAILVIGAGVVLITKRRMEA